MGISETTHRPPKPSQRRTILHHRARAYASQHGREHEWEGEVVEYFPVGGADRGGCISGLVVEEVF